MFKEKAMARSNFSTWELRKMWRLTKTKKVSIVCFVAGRDQSRHSATFYSWKIWGKKQKLNTNWMMQKDVSHKNAIDEKNPSWETPQVKQETWLPTISGFFFLNLFFFFFYIYYRCEYSVSVVHLSFGGFRIYFHVCLFFHSFHPQPSCLSKACPFGLFISLLVTAHHYQCEWAKGAYIICMGVIMVPDSLWVTAKSRRPTDSYIFI